MGIRVEPEKEVEFCDNCGQEGRFLQYCICCGEAYCVLCNAIIAGCVHSPDICRKCASDEKVIETVKDCANELIPIIEKRDEHIKRLKKGVLKRRDKNDI